MDVPASHGNERNIGKPAGLREFLALLVNIFSQDGGQNAWLPFDTAPSSIKRKAKNGMPG